MISFFQLFVDISIIKGSGFSDFIIFHSQEEIVHMLSVIQYVSSSCGLAKQTVFFKTVSCKCLSENETINCTECSNIILFFKMVGGGRKHKGAICHPGKSCCPCAICKKESFRYYFHLFDRRSNIELVQYFKDKRKPQ